MFAHIFLLLVLGLSFVVADVADIETCLFHLYSVDASCSNNLTVGQLPGGQLQGSKLTEPATWFRLFDGRLLDHALRGCWWAPVSTVLVCDVAFSDVEEPDMLFSVTTHGDAQALSYNGTFSFFACRSGRYDKVNYYLEQPDATCPQVFLHVDPDMSCFDEPFLTMTTTPALHFSTPVPSATESTSTDDLLSTAYDTETVGESTSTAHDTESPATYDTDGPRVTTLIFQTTTPTLTITVDEPPPTSDSYPPPSTLPLTSSIRPQYHSLSTLLSPPLPSLTAPSINLTALPPTTFPSLSIPKPFTTGLFSWTNSSFPSTLKTKTLSPGVYGSGRGSSLSMQTPTVYYGTAGFSRPPRTPTPSYEPMPLVTTLIFHTEREEGEGSVTTGPVVETFTVTAEGGVVVTFAVEVER
uniref:Uncharacterized protein n=2 Tax=Podospora anserina (strain S / ATCC MYA-4624 / DSM 980 / FGSC 10383) TaxID=515849 RepID=A0A090D3V9_PODAN|nr:Putative protein of unknown function [Podospora anserina S mat+]